jgi:hypothetical protein
MGQSSSLLICPWPEQGIEFRAGVFLEIGMVVLETTLAGVWAWVVFGESLLATRLKASVAGEDCCYGGQTPGGLWGTDLRLAATPRGSSTAIRSHHEHYQRCKCQLYGC